jgi:hypothetical protein
MPFPRKNKAKKLAAKAYKLENKMEQQMDKGMKFRSSLSSSRLQRVENRMRKKGGCCNG